MGGTRYIMTKKATEKSDVYAFGQLMLEMLCGRGNLVRSIPNFTEKKDLHLAEYVRRSSTEKNLNLFLRQL